MQIYWNKRKCFHKKRVQLPQDCFLDTNMAVVTSCENTLLGTFMSKDDDNGSENDGKKMNLRFSKLIRVYLGPLNMSNAGDFSWCWSLKDFIQVQKEEGKFVVVCPRPP